MMIVVWGFLTPFEKQDLMLKYLDYKFKGVDL